MASFKKRWLYFKIFLVILIILGVFLRFYNLDRKVYWYDEAFTLLRVSGYTRSEYLDEAFQGNTISTIDLQQYQQVVPEKNWQDTLRSLSEDVHPPLYFLLTRGWLQFWGNPITATRSLTALFGVLAFGGFYWLCRELFRDSFVALLGLGVFAISPFHILYAQEARMYSLLTLAIVFTSASLLQALRQNHKGNWLVYIMSLILGYYSHLYFIFFAFSQVVYVAIQQKFKFTKAARSFAIAFTLGSLAFLPWLVVIFSNLAKIDKITSSAQKSVATTVIIKALVANLGQVFIDVGLGTYFAPLVLVLVLYAFYYLIRYAPNSTWQFIVVLVGINAAAIILPDLILGGQGSTRSRYFIPCYIGIEIAVAYLIVLKLKSRRQISQYVGLILAVFVFGGGFISDGISAQSEVWWNKGHSRYNLEIARIINQTEQPLVLSDIYSLNPIDFLALSHYLKPDVQFRLGEMGDRELQNFPLDANLFVYNPSPQMRESLEKYYQVQPFQHHIKLLRLKSHANSSSANSE